MQPASSKEKHVVSLTVCIHGQQDVNLGVEGVNLALIFFHAYMINQKEF